MLNLKKQFFLGIGLATVGLASTPTSANAFTSGSMSGYTDTDFINQIKNGEINEVFVAEGRIGNNATNGTQEVSINSPIAPDENGKIKGGNPYTQGQRSWGDGDGDDFVDFLLEYDGTNVIYQIGQEELTTTVVGNATDIFIRTRAKENSSVSLTNLIFNGSAIGTTSSTGTTTRDIDYFHIGDITTPFTLTGKALFTWEGTKPKNSHTAFQIKVSNTPNTKKTPEPGTLGAMMMLGMVGAGYTHRRKKLQKI